MKQQGEPAGGWGSLKDIVESELSQRAGPGALETLAHLNKPEGTACTSCAWIKPEKPSLFEFCENGAKATLWDLTSARCTPEIFAKHSVSELATHDAHALEMLGRLTEPMRYDPSSDRYVRASWAEAFEAIGARLRMIDPQSATFYASGKAALEPSYLYALFARAYGHNNLPDSSNMCHETTSVGLKKVIGSPVGTCQEEDFEHCDAIFYLGQNPGTNSPRILHPLQRAVQRGCRIISFNPLRETGLTAFVNPQNPIQMTLGKPTNLSHLYLQVRPGGDIAALMGVCKHVLAKDAEARSHGKLAVIDDRFVQEHTIGFEAFVQKLDGTDWGELEVASGITRAEMEAAGDVYVQASNVMGIYGMGLTQHVHGAESIGLLVNLLMLKGNIGRQGAGCSPIRGHSNVQGQRTVGITEKVSLAPVEKYRELFDLETPPNDGHTTVDFLEAVIEGTAKAFIGLGGNLAMAVPDHGPVHAAWREMELTVHIATRLNHTHLMPGRESWLLPCLVRAEEDMQASGNQWVSIEDSFSHVTGSMGRRTPAGNELKSETAIVCEIARATLDPHPKLRWDKWQTDYRIIRSLISRTFPDQFHEMSERMNQPGGFFRGNPARERIWKTESGKAEFTDPSVLNACGKERPENGFHLMTLRSHDQFNTTVYGYKDRLRGIEGDRMIVMMNRADMDAHGLDEGTQIALRTIYDDGIERQVSGLTVRPYDVPQGAMFGYFPELNPLIPRGHHDELSKTPASKGVPVALVLSD